MFVLLLLSISGLIDSLYLTWEHYQKVIPPCTVNHLLPILSDCGKVLTSPYSVAFGIPLALFGVFHYGLLSVLFTSTFFSKNKLIKYAAIIESIGGLFASIYFMYIQLIVIKSICIYCTLSALISFIIIYLVFKKLRKERFELHLWLYGFMYQNFVKPVYFLLTPEFIHNRMVFFGELLSKTPIIKLVGSKFIYKDKSLKQKVSGITFENPVGLAAGFDYNANLTQTLYYLNFGFQSVGTITNIPYEGNPPPRLGRLPKSRSLMVNKGFKNLGADLTAKKLVLSGADGFKIPVGISIGVSNSKNIITLFQAIEDIKKSFQIFEKAKVNNSYYELNISCPNLINTKNLSFYLPKNLQLLLTMINKLRLKKPVFIKMPIEKTNREILVMLKVITQHKSIKGIIFGNLQKDRNHPSLVKSEVEKFKVGYFSGKACEERSNELIKLVYRKYRGKLIIIGCGGVFSGADAYKKIKLGATLIQLITGMIFQCPQLIAQINLELIDLLKKDGFRNIKGAIGKENN